MHEGKQLRQSNDPGFLHVKGQKQPDSPQQGEKTQDRGGIGCKKAVFSAQKIDRQHGDIKKEHSAERGINAYHFRASFFDRFLSVILYELPPLSPRAA